MSTLIKKLLKMNMLSGGGFTPKNISDLRLWLRADQGIFTDDAATTPAAADGDVIAVWQDQSGNGYHVSQTDNTKRPLLKIGANGINGKPTILFDGSNDYLRRAVADWLAADSGGHIFVVVRLTEPPATTGTFIASSDEAATAYALSFRIATVTTQRAGIFQDSLSTDDSGYGNNALATNTTYVLSLSSSGTAWTIRRNAAAETLTFVSGANSGDWFADTANRDNFTLGALKITVETAFLKGSIAEVIVTGSELGAAQLANMETYLNARYAAY